MSNIIPICYHCGHSVAVCNAKYQAIKSARIKQEEADDEAKRLFNEAKQNAENLIKDRQLIDKGYDKKRCNGCDRSLNDYLSLETTKEINNIPFCGLCLGTTKYGFTYMSPKVLTELKKHLDVIYCKITGCPHPVITHDATCVKYQACHEHWVYLAEEAIKTQMCRS